MMNKGIAIAGNLIVDYIKHIENYPSPQMLTTITDASHSTGGLCCNCVLTLAKLDPDLPVKAIGLVGDDEAGGYILSQFAAHPSVDASRVQKQGSTSYTDVMTVKDTGARTFFHYRGSNMLLAPGHFDFSKLDADIMHIGYILLLDALDAPDTPDTPDTHETPETPDETGGVYPTAMCRVLDAAQKAGVQTSIDVVSEQGERFPKLVPPALRYADYCIINEIEASYTTGIRLRDFNERPLAANLPAACRALMKMGVGRWVVIHMPELACGLERGGSEQAGGLKDGGGFVLESSWNIPDGFKKSSVGAGDAFASGILYGAYNGWSLAKSIRVAGAVAAYSLSGMGACDSIKPLPDIMAEMEALCGRK
jgi:sugar/nucleoside kinase (ribokinase family)